jgi:glutamate N-acetyltransferase/amino-acid N-acetyltransferase
MCGVPIEPDRITLRIGGIPAYRRGVPVPDRSGSLARVMRREIVEASLDLERGGRSATITTCDLSDEYIRINADYTT